MIDVDNDMFVFGRYETINIRVKKNPTNGDIIKALFPDMGEPHFYGMKEYMYDTDWWNTPYKRGE